MKLASWVLLGLLVLLVWVQAAHPIANPDFGWHVAMGRWILDHGAVPDAEPFTHTARGAPMVAHQWLSQVGYAATIDAVGVVGLRWANAVLACLAVLLLFVWLRRAGCSPGVALLACVVWAFLAEGRFQLRPHMWNLLLFVAAYGALFVARPRLSPAQLAGFFGLGVLWINLHSGAVLLAAVAAIHAAVATFEQRALGRSPSETELGEGRPGRLWALAVAVALALVISPNGIAIFRYVLESGTVNADLSVEWAGLASAGSLESRSPLWLALFFGVTLAAWVVAFVERRREPLASVAVVLFVTALPFVSQRFVWTCFVPLLFVASRWKAPRSLDLGAGLVAAGAVLILALRIDPAQLGGSLGASSNFFPAVFPAGAMSFLEEVGLEGNLFNSNKWGGYVLYRTHDRYPVFVDGRWITIGEQVVRDSHTIAMRASGYEKLLDDYGIEILLVHRGWMSREIRDAGGWVPVFENFNSGVYLREGPHLAANVARCARYYARRRIPFDGQSGFSERAGVEANPAWARRHRVQRRHLDQFGEHGRRALGETARWVEGW